MKTPAMTPFWGPPTSYLNFCEEDYGVTRYIAEFVNTLSSLVFVAYGIYGLRHSRSKINDSGARFVSHVGLIGVGVCSAGYHMTLKYHTQMSDELSMHLLTTPLLYRLLTFESSPVHAKVVGTILSVLFTMVMLVHMIMDEFLLHATTFGLAVLLIVIRSRRLIFQQVPDPEVRQRFRRITNFGLSNFILGYLLWLADGWACRFLTDLRQTVGLPLAFVFELHGWWHMLTAVGGYIAVAIVDVIKSGEVYRDPVEDLAWPVPLAVKFLSSARSGKNKALS